MSTQKTNWAKISIRLSSKEEQLKIIDLFKKSKAKTITTFVKTQIFRENIPQINHSQKKTNLENILSKIRYEINKIGVNYNQAVTVLNQRKGDYPTNKLTKELINYTNQLNKQIKALNNILQKNDSRDK